MNKNSRRSKIGIVFKLFFGFITLFFVIDLFNKTMYEAKNYQSASNGFLILEPSSYEEVWKESMSDISGMTLWDKYNAGLAINDGSDTDGDGLTDKDEIEVYGSNPLKQSTSDDLYSDYYKVSNGLDVNQYNEYQGEMRYEYNQCPNVLLNAQIPSDFYASVKDTTESNSLVGINMYRSFEIYNYSGNVSVDINDIFLEYGIGPNDIKVYLSDGIQIKKVSFTSENTTITLKDSLNKDFRYDLFITDNSFFTEIFIAVQGVHCIGDSLGKVEGKVLILGSPLLNDIVNMNFYVYCEDLGSQEENHQLYTQCVDNVAEMAGEEIRAKFSIDNVTFLSKSEIERIYSANKSMLPIFEYEDDSDIKIWKWLYLFYMYDSDFSYEYEEEEPDISTIFKVSVDTLPFGNFKTDKNQSGNCLGLTYFTSYLFNQGTFPYEGKYINGALINEWDLSTDPDNSTLLDKELFDYKTSDFIQEHTEKGYVVSNEFTEGEIDFIEMIESNTRLGNYYVNSIYQYNYGGQNRRVFFDYSLIDEMKELIDQKKVLNVCMRMVDGNGHAIIVYGYEEDAQDSNVLWLYVYDPNFPITQIDESILSDTGFKIKIEKRMSPSGNLSFDYSYFPVGDDFYGATSNLAMTKNPFMLVLDDKWMDINPSAKTTGFNSVFDYWYSSDFIEKEQDFTAQCHYSDSYFYMPASGEKPRDGYNASLATTSMNFAMSCFASTYGGSEDYTYKSKNAEEFLVKSGFSEIEINDSFKEKPGDDSIGVISGKKTIYVDGKKTTLIALGIRGAGYENEWTSNFTIGLTGQHEGFRIAKEQVLTHLKEYIKDHKITGKIKIWLAGYSRAAATANLVAGALGDGEYLGKGISYSNKDIYAYCFESPMGALGKQIKDESKYYHIYNILNINDIVTKVAPKEWGFVRYGVDTYLPDRTTDGNQYPSKLRMMLSLLEQTGSYNQLSEYFQEKELSVYSLDDFEDASTRSLSVYLDDATRDLSRIMMNRVEYTAKYQPLIRYCTQSIFGDKSIDDMDPVDLYSAILSLFLVMKDTPFYPDHDSLTVLEFSEFVNTILYYYVDGFNENGSNIIMSAHFPEYCLSWLMSQDPEYVFIPKVFAGSGSYRVVILNCPIDVKVYDSNRDLVAEIKNDTVQEEGENYVVSHVNCCGEKVVYLPSNMSYEVELIGTDTGTVNVSIQEYSGDSSMTVRLENYLDINVHSADVIRISIPQYTEEDYVTENDSSSLVYQVKDTAGNDILPTFSFKNNEVEKQIKTINFTSEDIQKGNVFGDRYKFVGEFVKVYAVPNAGYEFEGWYTEDVLISSEKEYRFRVSEDVHLVAKFIEDEQTGNQVPPTQTPVTETIQNIGNTESNNHFLVYGLGAIVTILVVYLCKKNIKI